MAMDVFGKAALSCGFNVQSLFFPAQDRRSAYVWGLVKLDKDPIRSKQVERSDLCLLLDPTLDMKPVLDAVRDGGSIMFNTTQKINLQVTRKKRLKAFVLDATGLSVNNKQFASIAMLGAVAKNMPKISIKSLKTVADKNAMDIIDEGFRNVKMVK